LQVFYFTLCPHCEYFIRLSLIPLVEAQLPGDRVHINVVPMYPPMLQALNKPDMCKAKDACRLALAPLCAFRQTSLAPTPADSPQLLQSVRFAACDISNTAEGKGRTPDATKACADSAGLVWEGTDGLQACTDAEESMDLLTAGSKSLLSAMEQLHNVIGFTEPPSMPWVLLDGDLLSCDGDGATCTATQTPSGDQPLPQPGSLLELVCRKLNPAPPVCSNTVALAQQNAGGSSAALKKAEEKAAECENCDEVGTFHWRWRRPAAGETESWSLLLPWPGPLVGVAFLALGLSATLAAWRHRTAILGSPASVADSELACGPVE